MTSRQCYQKRVQIEQAMYLLDEALDTINELADADEAHRFLAQAHAALGDELEQLNQRALRVVSEETAKQRRSFCRYRGGPDWPLKFESAPLTREERFEADELAREVTENQGWWA